MLRPTNQGHPIEAFKCQVKQFLLTLKTDNRKKDISNLEKVEENKIDSNKK